MEVIDFVFAIAILLMSVVLHEVAHGYAAEALGDPTARLQGRLTLNPLSHLDFVGSLLVPTVSFLMGGFIFGWAKPVPYNPYNLRNQKWGEALVAAAGPAVNILLAIFFGICIRIAMEFGLSVEFVRFASLIVLINIILAFFNLIPIPPLDGSKILFSLFPVSARRYMYFLERFGLIIVIIFIFTLWRLIFPVVSLVFSLITGLGV